MNISDLITAFLADQSNLTTKSTHFAYSVRAQSCLTGRVSVTSGHWYIGTIETDGKVIQAGQSYGNIGVYYIKIPTGPNWYIVA
jgi:uncharacterized protein affecting Mg2+/Co2+ transport